MLRARWAAAKGLLAYDAYDDLGKSTIMCIISQEIFCKPSTATASNYERSFVINTLFQ